MDDGCVVRFSGPFLAFLTFGVCPAMTKLDWREFEASIREECQLAIARWMKRNPKRKAYAIAFHECYAEMDGVITIPQLGINVSDPETLVTNFEETGWKWNSADWPWLDIFPSRTRLNRLERALTQEACRGSQTHWLKTHKRFFTMLIRISKLLYQQHVKSPQVTSEFVVYVDDEDGGLDTIRRSIPTGLFRKHFQKFEKQVPKVDGMSPEGMAERYLEDMFSFEKEILALGNDAVGPILRKLADPEIGCAAAGLLADLNISSKPVINSLRNWVSTGDEGMAEHCSMALGLLGDVEHLFSRLADKKTRAPAVMGILTRLKERASDRMEPLPLDYQYVERLLAIKSASIRRQVEDELKPGSSKIRIALEDVDEALRGLASDELILRQHAVCVLGDRSLGVQCGKKILPALAERLNDSVANMRRLALLQLSNWKAAARPYRDQMKLLIKDKDDSVRKCACYVLNDGPEPNSRR